MSRKEAVQSSAMGSMKFREPNCLDRALARARSAIDDIGGW
jgi:hypothetical protein